jgi:hypothetical protein
MAYFDWIFPIDKTLPPNGRTSLSPESKSSSAFLVYGPCADFNSEGHSVRGSDDGTKYLKVVSRSMATTNTCRPQLAERDIDLLRSANRLSELFDWSNHAANSGIQASADRCSDHPSLQIYQKETSSSTQLTFNELRFSAAGTLFGVTASAKELTDPETKPRVGGGDSQRGKLPPMSISIDMNSSCVTRISCTRSKLRPCWLQKSFLADSNERKESIGGLYLWSSHR